jgi:hypothetical protein
VEVDTVATDVAKNVFALCGSNSAGQVDIKIRFFSRAASHQD